MVRRSRLDETSRILRMIGAGISVLAAGSIGALAGTWIGVSAPSEQSNWSDATQMAAMPCDKPREVYPRLDESINVLMVGFDYNGSGRQLTTEGGRTRADTMILVRIDPSQHRISALSIP